MVFWTVPLAGKAIVSPLTVILPELCFSDVLRLSWLSAGCADAGAFVACACQLLVVFCSSRLLADVLPARAKPPVKPKTPKNARPLIRCSLFHQGIHTPI